MARNNYNYSFTLVELLLVVVLLGVTASLVLPDLGSFYNRILLENTTEDIVSLMHYGRNRAVMRRQQIRLEIDGLFRHYRLAIVNPPVKEGSRESTGQKIPGRWGREVKVPSELTLSSTSRAVNFLPDGRIDPVRLDVCYQSECRGISSLLQRGHVEIVNPGAGR